jgi:hypothetical protein
MLGEIWYGSSGLHLIGAPTYSVHISAFSEDLKKLGQGHLVLDQSQVVLSESVLSQEEHLATSLELEDLVQWDKARLPSIRGLLTISGTLRTTYHGLGGKEQGGQP